MHTRFDKDPVPVHWSDEEAVALRSFRVFVESESQRVKGGITGLAKILGYPKADSVYQIARADQKVGLEMLKRLHDAGYSVQSIHPEHAFSKALAGNSSEIHIPELHYGVQIAEQAQGLVFRAVFARASQVPPGCFFVRATDDPKSRVVWVCDPNYDGSYTGRKIVIDSPQGLSITQSVDSDQEGRVVGVVILETIEVHQA